MSVEGVITAARHSFHAALFGGPLTADSLGVLSIADSGSAVSRRIAAALAERLGVARTAAKAEGQSAGAAFETLVADFLRATFLRLSHLRPGAWEICDTTTHGKVQITNFSQYDHLMRLKRKADADPDLRAALGGDYLIAPDVVVLRTAEPDEVLNAVGAIVDERSAQLAPLRAANTSGPPVRFLHASVSCKWTLRSDRAQNARSEALNLLRNRKGHAPHVVAVTAEPMPSRLASLALGTNDLDCAYHIALAELRDAVAESVDGERSEQDATLRMLIEGRRLRDISDLPLDLAT